MCLLSVLILILDPKREEDRNDRTLSKTPFICAFSTGVRTGGAEWDFVIHREPPSRRGIFGTPTFFVGPEMFFDRTGWRW